MVEQTCNLKMRRTAELGASAVLVIGLVIGMTSPVLYQDNHRTVAKRDGTAAAGAKTGHLESGINGVVVA